MKKIIMLLGYSQRELATVPQDHQEGRARCTTFRFPVPAHPRRWIKMLVFYLEEAISRPSLAVGWHDIPTTISRSRANLAGARGAGRRAAVGDVDVGIRDDAADGVRGAAAATNSSSGSSIDPEAITSAPAVRIADDLLVVLTAALEAQAALVAAGTRQAERSGALPIVALCALASVAAGRSRGRAGRVERDARDACAVEASLGRGALRDPVVNEALQEPRKPLRR
ncbi:hypothetical protein DFJ74DRAFT_654333 [Hyaloraphidium curvatum]|nr:hypothetical protein DFJ74DRAFT_654333 [Hyaloraphidium curvatum]